MPKLPERHVLKSKERIDWQNQITQLLVIS